MNKKGRKTAEKNVAPESWSKYTTEAALLDQKHLTCLPLKRRQIVTKTENGFKFKNGNNNFFNVCCRK